MTAYPLPSLVTVDGTYSFELYSATAGLTVPTIQTIKSITPLKESANVIVGTSEITNVQIEFRDDDSTYSQGFWFKQFKVETWLRIYLDEGAGDTFFFFGMIDTLSPGSIDWQESYLGANRIRTATVTFLSIARKVFDMEIDDWIAEVLANDEETTNSDQAAVSSVISVPGLFAALLSGSGLNPSYDVADVSLVYGSATDFTWGEGVGDYRADEIYVPTEYIVSTGPTVTSPTVYFDTSSANCLSVQLDGTGYYSEMGALVKDILFNFGLQMRMDYDTVGDRHLIQLMHRHDVYTGTLDFSNREKASSGFGASKLLLDSVRASDLMDDTKFIWISKKYCRFSSPATPPNRVKFDVDQQIPFIIDDTALGEGNHSLYYWAGTGNDAVFITGCKYYDGPIGGAAFDDPLKMQGSAADYLYQMFSENKGTVTRRYGQMTADAGSGETHTAVGIMRRVEINDLDSTVTYFANTVTKDPVTHEIEVEWIEE